MGLDIRWPIGLMFTLIGLLLVGFGAVRPTDSVSLDININLVWGLVLLVFGGLMIFGAATGGKTPPGK